MRYIIANLAKAVAAGFDASTHRTSDTEILLNEKEVLLSPALDRKLEERAALIDGEVLSGPDARDKSIHWESASFKRDEVQGAAGTAGSADGDTTKATIKK